MFPVCHGLMHVEKSKNSIMGKVFSWFCECKKRKSQTVNLKTKVEEPRNIPSQVPLKEPGNVKQPGRISGRGFAKELRPLYTTGFKKKFQNPWSPHRPTTNFFIPAHHWD
jgi:hypothetical protein